MKKINHLPNEVPPVINKFNNEDILRCVECDLICLLKLKYIEGKTYINYNFENIHKGNILLKAYYEKNKKKMLGDFFIVLNDKYFYVFMYNKSS